ncbi:MAG: hypothetical protein AAGJ31_16045, partial [Verrucomicrobiota bacterium]
MSPLVFLLLPPFMGSTEEIQHLDATASNFAFGTNPTEIAQWIDQSSRGNHATPMGSDLLIFDETDLLGSGLPGVDFGPFRNRLELFSSLASDSWLDQSVASAQGFTVFVAFQANSVIGSWNDLLGNTSGSAGFHLRFSSGGQMRAALGGKQLVIDGQRIIAGDTIVLAFRYDPLTKEMLLWDSKNRVDTYGFLEESDFSNGNGVTLGSTSTGGRYIDGLVGEV